MATNLLPISSAGGFTTAGNITTEVSASPAPSINGFSSVSADNFSLMAGNINGGIATVVDDGINSIALALGAQMDVYGFPFSQITRGQLTISGVTTPSEVNGTWYYQSINTNTYQIYTDSTYSALVDATGWSAYTGGGTVAITKQVPAANIVINTNGYFTTFDNTGNLTVPGNINLPNSSTLSFGDTPVTNRYYIDATRTDTYTQNGSQARPFKTIAGAQAAIATAISGGLNPEVEPIYMILLSNITENVTLATNHVYLVGQSGQIHQPIILSGNVTVEPASGTLSSNHFSISGLEIVGGTNGKAIYVTGTYPTRLSLQDVWITANGTGAGLYQDNTGTGTYTHGGPIKVSHNGSGDVYCFDIRKGTASFESVETSGATQVGAAGPGATLTFNNSQLDANGDVVVETYGSGVLVVTNSVIKNSQANGFGIKLNAVANVAGTVSVGQSAFNVPIGTGSAVWLDPNTTAGLSGVFAWSGASFYPSTNTTISPTLIPGPLAILVGTQVSPIFYGDITSYALAQDWDLIDNNSSALSFDTTGKAGILELVTTNSAEGVKMSGYANVTGNVIAGNLMGPHANGNSNVNIATANGNVTITAVGNTTMTITGTGANITGTLNVTGNITGNTNGFAVGYLNIPQVSASNTTLALTDAGKHYYSTTAGNFTLTVPNNSSAAFATGTAISIVVQAAGNILVNAASGVTLYMAGNSTAANRVVGGYGMATLMKVASDTWFINGTGVS